MGFFKEFKEDFSQAVNELLPEEETGKEETQDQLVNTLDTDENSSEEISDSERMKVWLEEFAGEETESLDDEVLMQDDLSEETMKNELEKNTLELEEEEGENMDDNVDLELLEALNADEEAEKVDTKESQMTKLRSTAIANDDEVTVITKGTTINGSISSDGSLEVNGTITGDVECLGKLSITGKIVGNSSAAEVYVNTERLEGSITSEGSVKVGLGTVIIGDIVATSGVIAGAIKGEVDVNGPIVIDSTAIIKGNIKAKSVQINNGAVIEGFCSLSYSSVDVDNIFE
jgi:cytoskeletal protein CcmA (bactofilin family)